MTLRSLSIKLVDSNPVISRRLLVPEAMNLHDLHRLIQSAMPWENCHMYEFHYKSEQYWYEEEDEVAKYFGDEPSHQTTKQWSLSKFLQHTHAKSFHYVYDMGDNWDHLIRVGAIVESKAGEIYPKLLVAKGAAPPEEIGGYTAIIGLLKHETNLNMSTTKRSVLGLKMILTPMLMYFPHSKKELKNSQSSIKRKLKVDFKKSVGY